MTRASPLGVFANSVTRDGLCVGTQLSVLMSRWISFTGLTRAGRAITKVAAAERSGCGRWSWVASAKCHRDFADANTCRRACGRRYMMDNTGQFRQRAVAHVDHRTLGL
jgi:hypothetical protein